MQLCAPTFLTYRKNTCPSEGLRGTGVAAETLPAKRGTGRFAVTAGVFSFTYKLWVLEDLQIAN